MTTRRMPLTYKTHRQLAETLRDIRARLWTVTDTVQQAYGVTHPATKLAARLVKMGNPLDQLRSVLDGCCGRECGLEMLRDDHGQSPYYMPRTGVVHAERGEMPPDARLDGGAP